MFDTEKSGRIDYSELKVTLEALGFEMEKRELLKLIEEYDPSETGKIEYADYVDLSKFKSD